MKTPDKPSTPRQPYVTNKSDSSSPKSPHRIRKPSSHESTEHRILHHKQVSFHVSNASYQQSNQLQVNVKSAISQQSGHRSSQHQVINQVNVKSTSENHPRPKNRKNRERLTPIASDRPGSAGVAPVARRGKQQDNGAPNAATGKIPNATDSASV